MINKLDNIIKELKNGDLSNIHNAELLINNSAINIVNKDKLNNTDLIIANKILWISNVLYNNTDLEKLPLDDGMYDLLLEKYKKYDSNYQVGSEVIHFNESNNTDINNKKEKIKIFNRISNSKECFYKDDIFGKVPVYTKEDNRKRIFKRKDNFTNISKRLVINEQKFPSLVGTLDKCKFVLNTQAREKNADNLQNVNILERDFFHKHIQDGIINYDTEICMSLELKYDGVSVVGEVTNELHQCFSRGDTNNKLTSDLTPVLSGYRFPRAYDFITEKPFGIKFEAIMTYNNLYKYNKLRNKNYSNCRTAISGLLSSTDAHLYKDFITLVPLETDLGLRRDIEIEFLNKYYYTGVEIRGTIIKGKYLQILYQIKRFVEEAEMLRPYVPFMYDGVVVSYVNEDIREKLGRDNSVNKYSIAIKFNPLKKQTKFTGYTYTVGQDGSITPMIHYLPVEFFGTIHDKSTGHSYNRFNQLNLRIDDIIDVEYVNDVMPYVTKPENSHNQNNKNPIVQFIEYCPSCGSKLVISESGKSIKCVNFECPEIKLKRVVAMFDKLNIKDFSEAHLKSIGMYSLYELCGLNKEYLSTVLGEKTTDKYISQINELITNKIYDYKIVGSLGFTGIASEKWKLIFNKYTLREIIEEYTNKQSLTSLLYNIKGIGDTTVDTINKEIKYFLKDLIFIYKVFNIINTKGQSKQISIRFSGCRNKELVNKLCNMGYDASGEKSVTKTTDILIIPNKNFKSSKINKISINTIVVDIDSFTSNIEYYINLVKR